MLTDFYVELWRNEETENIMSVQSHRELIHPTGYTGVRANSVQYVFFFLLYIVGDEPCADAGVFHSGDAEVEPEEAIFVELI